MPRAAPAPPLRLPPTLAALVLLALAPGAATAQLVQSGSGATNADLLPVVELFRTQLGGALNPNVPGSFADGRREINWDGVPAAVSAPNQLPADFFNVNSPRGVVFSTPGSGFQVSANAGEGPVEFENLNPGYPDRFTTFSPQKLFTALASNTMDVRFFVPGSTTPASVRGFGAVFTDVDVANTTSLAFFGAGDELLGTFFAPALDNGLSFVGVSFTSDVVTRVRITTGTAALGPDEALPGTDVVALDDFIYGEPQAAVIPEPASWLLLGSGLAGLAGLTAVRRRRA